MFTRFKDLPIELRLQIWESALRPSKFRGLHYFSIAECTEEDIAAAKRCSITKKQFFRLGVPASPISALVNKLLGIGQSHYTPRDTQLYKIRERPGHAWFEGNHSLCAWDAGLATACMESRYVFLKALSKHNNHTRFNMREIEVQHGDDTAFFRVNSSRDMIVLSFEHESLASTKNVDWVRLLRRVPIHRLPGVIGNIALEYNPNWRLESYANLNEAVLEPTALGVAVRVFAAWSRGELTGCCIWLIDRAMFAFDLLHSDDWPRRKVYSDQHSYYIETYWEDHEFWSRTATERVCAWAFVNRLKCWDSWRRLDTRSPSRAMESGPCCFGVLAHVHAPGPGMPKRQLSG